MVFLESTSRGNLPHIGTYTKDLHVGLAELLGQAAGLMPGVGSWTTGTRGATFALGTKAGGGAATARCLAEVACHVSPP